MAGEEKGCMQIRVNRTHFHPTTLSSIGPHLELFRLCGALKAVRTDLGGQKVANHIQEHNQMVQQIVRQLHRLVHQLRAEATHFERALCLCHFVLFQHLNGGYSLTKTKAEMGARSRIFAASLRS